jgi:LL-diaminopimelate aminotransferase
MKIADRISDVKAYYFAGKLAEIKKLNQSGKSIINLGIGSPNTEPDAAVKKALVKAVLAHGSYGYQPYKGFEVLRKAIAEWYLKLYKIKLNAESEILPLMGSKEGISFISLAFLQKGVKVLIPNPGYPAYAAAAKIAGAEVVYYDLKEENDWYPDFEQLEKIVDDKCRMIWVNYPNMPTTQEASYDLFSKLIDFAQKQGLLLCNDNPYSLISSAKPLSILAVPGAEKVAIELNSLSKSHNLAGARVGMLLGAEQILKQVFKVYSNFSSGMFLPLQLAAVEALKVPDTWYLSLNKIYEQRRKTAQEIMDILGCSYSSESKGLFVWGKIPPEYEDAIQLSDFLLYKAKVFLSPGNIFGSNGNQYIRLSLCSDIQQLETAKISIKKLINTIKVNHHENQQLAETL